MALVVPSEHTQEKTHHWVGKPQKLMPDYTRGDSESRDASRRVDSEDSCTPKRKRVGLNEDRGNVYNVPSEVFRISKMSVSERKDLELRFRADLEHVQLLRKKLESLNGVTLSSLRNGQEKKLKRAPPGEPFAALMKQCDSVLDKLMKHKFGWVFNKPVDVVALNIPDYYTVIKHPMDLGTIKRRISSGAYTSPWEFVADVRLTFTNAITYNPPRNDVHLMADKLSKFFETKWKPIEKKLTLNDSSLPSRKRKPSPVNHHAEVQEEAKPKVLPSVKFELINRLGSMTEDMPAEVMDFLRKQNEVVNEADNEMEIDLDALSDDKFLELKKLLDSYMPDTQTKQQQQVKGEPLKAEILREASVSNLTMPPCEDEYVDIGGDDLLLSSYPSLNIEKEPGSKSNHCESLSSDSSSSSDSDACSSSGSESDDTSSPDAKTAEGIVRADSARGQDTRNIRSPLNMNKPFGPLDRNDEDVQPKPVRVDEENAPSERQVSPEKLYRAALLRNRFVDTILKCQEKTLDQGDPEKLQHWREELEKKQKEEKARIQAEAKAADDARKSKAAAVAKRERECEREAARQALLKMEKTVEIDQNCLILKGLEMFRSVPDDCEPNNSVDEMSLDCFELCGSNPLEQLGLFMKRDEEDEETELRTVPTNHLEVEIN